MKEKNLETVPLGFANGQAFGAPFNKEEKEKMILRASEAYGIFLDELKCDWKNDPNSKDTPLRVAKTFVNELWKGRYDSPPSIKSFPSDGYENIILERNIKSFSMCSHHHQVIESKVHIAYIPGRKGRVIGLSKLNRIVEFFSRRGAIQEQLTVAIHNAIDKICKDNIGVMVVIVGKHNCVRIRGVEHDHSDMVTSKISGVFTDHTKTAKGEVLELLKLN